MPELRPKEARATLVYLCGHRGMRSSLSSSLRDNREYAHNVSNHDWIVKLIWDLRTFPQLSMETSGCISLPRHGLEEAGNLSAYGLHDVIWDAVDMHRLQPH